MGYQEERGRLEELATSDDVTQEQRDAAAEVLLKLFDDQIGAILNKMKARTQEYNAFISKLKGVVGKIEANQITDAMAEMDKTVTNINNAAE